MRSDFAYDPVTAIDESAAVGDTALVFAEIRRTMGIPPGHLDLARTRGHG
jgi:hypothetical protein